MPFLVFKVWSKEDDLVFPEFGVTIGEGDNVLSLMLDDPQPLVDALTSEGCEVREVINLDVLATDGVSELPVSPGGEPQLEESHDREVVQDT